MSFIASCPGCSKVFRPRTVTADACWDSVSSHLKTKSRQGCTVHMAIHTALYRNPFGCPACNQIFSTKVGGMVHLSSMNDDSHYRFKIVDVNSSNLAPLVLNNIAELSSTPVVRGTGLAGQLYSAAKSGNLDSVRRLLEAGVDPNSGGEDGFTPLMTAAEAGHADVVQLLICNPKCNAALRNAYGQVLLPQARPHMRLSRSFLTS